MVQMEPRGSPHEALYNTQALTFEPRCDPNRCTTNPPVLPVRGAVYSVFLSCDMEARRTRGHE